MYVDDCIILSKDKSVMNNFIYSLQHGQENYIFADEKEVDKYLGVDIVRSKSNNGIKLKQPFWIERCLKAIEIDSSMNIKKIFSTKTFTP